VEPLYLLAFDHRGSFQEDLYGIEGPPDEPATARIAAGKQTIFAGYRLALTRGAPPTSAGVLVDEQFGAAIARAARAAGHVLAMPVEHSGHTEFAFEYEDWAAHIEAFQPDYVKVLVRHNPAGDRESNGRQAEKLRELSRWLRGREEYRFLFELLVPPTPQQLEAAGDTEAFDRSVRPALVAQAIAELQQAGVEPDVWKVEGLYRREDCDRVATQAQIDGVDVRCIVLGRGADEKLVERWLRVGAATRGFAGFAVGRTIWFDALKAMLDGEIDAAEAEERIAARYLREIEVYRSAAIEGQPA
jgi:myo-inositol catabolism protein IolC